MASARKRVKRDDDVAADHGPFDRPGAMPGRGGLRRIWKSLGYSLAGVAHGGRTEPAIQQEFFIAAVGFGLSFIVATSPWVWVALNASLLFVLTIECLNTALERLCNHVMPDPHDDIRVTKDMGSAAVFFALLLAGVVWLAALLARFGLVG